MKPLFGLHPVVAAAVGVTVLVGVGVVGKAALTPGNSGSNNFALFRTATPTPTPLPTPTNTPTPTPSPTPSPTPVPKKAPAATCATQHLDASVSLTAPCHGQKVGSTFRLKASTPDLGKADEWWVRVTDSSGNTLYNQMVVGYANGPVVNFDYEVKLKQAGSGAGTVTFFVEDPGTRAQRNLAIISVTF